MKTILSRINNTKFLFLFFFLQGWLLEAQAQRELNKKFETITESESTLELFTIKKNIHISTDEFLDQYVDMLNLVKGSEMKLVRSEKDELGFTNSRYQQYVHGYKVMEAEMVIHEKDGYVQYVNGMYLQVNPESETVLQSETNGLQLALKEINSHDYLWLNQQAESDYKKTKKDSSATLYPKGELIFVAVPGSFKKAYRLCWKYRISVNPATESFDVYIDASNGKLINKIPITMSCNGGSSTTLWNGNRTIYTFPLPPLGYMLFNTCNTSPIHTLNGNGNYNGIGATEFIDDDNNWPTTSLGKYAAQTQFGSQQSRNYYAVIHGREGYDNNGHEFKAYLNPGYTNNAYFTNSTEATSFGGTTTGGSPFISLDIAGHEHTHGMIYFTSNLTYSGESGALNESFADIFGEAVEAFTLGSNDWIVGNELGGGGLRNFMNPNAKSQPDTYLSSVDWYTGTNDNGGVHTNSGVQNFWFYLLSEGGSGINDNGDAYCVNGIGFNKARMIAYRTYLNLTSGAGYGNVRLVSIQAAKDLYGVSSNEATQTAKAWSAVGVGPVILTYIPSITIAASNNSFCSGSLSNVTFTATPVNAVSPIFQWRKNGVPITGATNSTYTISGLENLDSIACTMTTFASCPGTPVISNSNKIEMIIYPANNAIISTSVSDASLCNGSSTNISAAMYSCQPIYNVGTANGDYIGRVAIYDDFLNPTTFNNITTGSSYPYYTIYPASGNTTVTLVATNYYRIQLSAGTYPNSNYLTAWIDYNQDSSFSDDERIKRVGPFGAYPDYGGGIGAFVIPPYAKNGLTRLRVREVRGTLNISPCDTYDYGETEDYWINISSSYSPISNQFTWSAGTSPSVGNTVSISPTYSQQYIVTSSDANGCTTTAKTQPIFVNNLNIDATITPQIVCPGSTTTFNATKNLNYCQPVGGGTTNGNYIAGVYLMDNVAWWLGYILSNGSGASSFPYITQYPASGSTTTTLVAGSSYTFYIVSGSAGGNYVAAFLDYEQDGILNMGLDKIGEVSLGANATGSISFTVPTWAKNGSVRLRIRSGEYPNVTSCTSWGQGETEDYTLTITGGVAPSTPNYVWSSGTTTLSGNPIVVSPTQSSTYTVTATDIDGCTSTSSNSLMVHNPASIAVNSASPASICAGESTTLSASSNSNSICQPIYSSGSGGGDYISSVYLFNPLGSTLSNSTGASSAPYYTLYPQSGSTTTTLTAGFTYYLTINVGSYSTFNNVAAWIDYNGDGTWFNVFEKIGESGNINSAFGSISFQFKVPTWALNGNCRLRIREVYSSYNLDPCATYTFGETEDYTITITGGSSSSISTFTWSPSTTPTTGSTVTASPISNSIYTVTATGSYGCTRTGTTTVSMKTNALFYQNASSICETSAVNFSGNINSCSGNAFNGNGSNYGASLLNSYALTATNNFTIEAWVKWNGANGTNQYIYYNGNASSNGYGILVNASNGNKLSIQCGGVNIANSSVSLPVGTWQHIVATRSGPAGGTWRLFIDGTITTITNQSTLPLIPSSGGTFVGRSSSSNEYFNGAIDEVRIWNTAISTFLIPNERVACISSPQTNLVGYWQFNEGLSSGTSCIDASGGGRTLTLSNANARTTSANYSWNFGDATSGNGLNTTHLYPGAGNYTATLTVTDITGCAASSTQNLYINPCVTNLNLIVYIQGYYQGSGMMTTVLSNQGIGSNPMIVDSITVELHDAMPPYALAQTTKSVLQIYGNASCTFPFSVANQSYYIVVKHRNGLETWSKFPVFISPNTNYNFASSASQAYGDNQVQIAPGLWAIYSGDLNDDENIDLLDLSFLENDINNFQFGYFATDLNGDGNVDLLDTPYLEENTNNFIFSLHP